MPSLVQSGHRARRAPRCAGRCPATSCRQALKKLLQVALLFTPKAAGNQRYYEITGEGTNARILAGGGFPIMVASPPGHPLMWNVELFGIIGQFA